MKLYYYLRDVDKLEREFARGALNQLQQYLRSPELNLQVYIRVLPQEIARQVSSALNGNELDIWLKINAVYNLRDARPVESEFSNSNFLLVCTSPGSELARISKHHSPQSLYGACFPDTNICVVYYFHDPYTMWHEIFHMLGAEDCYLVTGKGEVTDRGPTCGKSNCIMQYGITSDEIGEWPFICEQNLERIRNRV